MTENMLEILKNIDSNKGQLINNLIKSNVLTVKDVVNASIENKDSSIILSVATYVNGLNSEDIEKLADAIIATNDAYYIYIFARYIKGAPIEKLANAIVTTKNLSYFYIFAYDVKNAPIAILANATIASGIARDIYIFARQIKGAPIDKLVEAIITTGNIEYYNLFMQNVQGIPEKYKNMTYAVLERKKQIEDDKKAMAELIELANNEDLKTIESGANTYRTLLLGTEAEVQEKPMTKVRKPEKQ